MTYNKDSIKSLDPIEHIRRRPGVYLPDIGIQGLHHLIEEVINNSVDEFLMGHGKQIQITVIYNKIGDKSSCKISVSDQGRGIPFGYREDMGMDVIEATLTKTMTGGKFEAGNYNTSSGMNGIGLKAVNAISKDLTVLSTKSKTACLAHFECGQKVSIKTFSSNGVDGTTISFVPDGSILETTEVDLNILVPRLKYLASILPGLEIHLRLVDREYDGNQSMVFKYDQPLVDIHENLGEQLFGYRHVDKGINVELTFHKTTASKILSFVNTVHTYDNGSHVDAIYAALTDSLKRLTGKLFTKYQLSQGMSLTISVFHQDPVFRGQHKGMLSDSSVKRIVYDSVLQSIYKSLQSNTPFLKYLVELMDQQEKLLRELDIQDAINTVKKSVKENRLPAKLSVAHNCTPETRELFIVEGDSAAGSVRRASNKKFQEVLPIRGKIINAHKSDYADVLANTDAVNIFLAVGAMEKSNTTLRTKNVFILTDADDDGKHIVSLLLSLFTVAFPSFVKDFNLHVVYPPLFSLVSGDLRMYGHDGKELVKKFKAKYSRRAYEIYRNKGLGEMDAGEMVEVIHPEKRKIDKVDLTDMSTIEMDKIMGIMGDVRRSLITESEGENNE